jgi:hypothetical protein
MLRQDAPHRIVNSDLTQYIAASAPLHCADGWSYLGRALACHALGDYDAARHLAYYAELRAAMSLLASEGIGIFNKQHFVVDVNRRCRMISGSRGTHQMAWLALAHWAAQASSTEFLAQIIRPDKRPLEDWIDYFASGMQWRHVGREWLNTWGMDLRSFGQDQAARNEASYRPTRLERIKQLTVVEQSRLMRDLWQLYEPMQSSGFDNLDRHLLRLSYDRTFRITEGVWPKDNPKHFEHKVASAVASMGYSGNEEQRWIEFLTRKNPLTADDPPIISEARLQAPPTSPRHHGQVISRASLLLRLATGAAAWILGQSGFSFNDLDFWWKPLGQNRGLWDTDPSDPQDLWMDVGAAISEMEKWENDGDAGHSLRSWRASQAGNIWICSECERIAFWGLAP